MQKRKKSLGKNVFDELPDKKVSKGLKQLIAGEGPKVQFDTREVEVRVKLTPSNIRKLDKLRKQLSSQGKGNFTRSQLIRIAISLLTLEDF